eukprot:CAMPEP_0167824326 /NCGR_PEP_ID=MMETSP0112_2-20121227/8721_1 /TAXON_ID=91324 /ORGANISM="Lotharella globosa, Strain CCCM811" /LENGTH=279 /DNA_ID=CAMNT_0007726255 /DNA_START=184 /DNA_END=1023 /DNA_ORIENTATION=+
MYTNLLIISVGFCLNTALNNVSLMHSTLALNQLVRAFAPVSIAVAAYYVQGRRPSLTKQWALVALVFGITMGLVSSPDFEMVGFLLCAASVMGLTSQVTLSASILGGDRIPLKTLDVIIYTAVPSIIILLPFAYLSGENDVTAQALQTIGLSRLVGLVVTGGALAFSYSIATVALIKYTSSAYYAAAGGFKLVMVMGFSFIAFDQQMSIPSLCGILIACAAFNANSFITFKETASTRPGGRKGRGGGRKKGGRLEDGDSTDEDDRTGLLSGNPKSIDDV